MLTCFHETTSNWYVCKPTEGAKGVGNILSLFWGTLMATLNLVWKKDTLVTSCLGLVWHAPHCFGCTTDKFKSKTVGHRRTVRRHYVIDCMMWEVYWLGGGRHFQSSSTLTINKDVSL